MTIVLAVANISKRFALRGKPAVQALDDVSFELVRGRALAVIGESGSGKTTLARIVLGLESADSGSAELFGTELDLGGSIAKRTGQGALVQVVFQDPYSSLDPLQTVGAMLMEIGRKHRADHRRPPREELVALLASVGLPEEVLEQRPGKLSGGQRQRVAIARALLPEPELLILDEAVSALDVSVQAQILNLLSSIRTKRQLTVLFITHDLGVVRQSCDDVIVMHRGRVVERGEVADVLDSPGHPYTRALRAAVPAPGWDPAAAAALADEIPALDER